MFTSRRKALTLLSASALAACAARVDEDAADLALTPPEIEGPFYPTNVASLERDADLTRLVGRASRAGGQVIEVRGRLLNPQGQPLANTLVELWQANAGGRYDHPLDAQNPVPLDADFQGYAALRTGADGGFTALTIKPGGYFVPQVGARRTPHLHWAFGEGAGRLVTQSYFPGEAANESDFVIRDMRVPVAPLIMAAGPAGAEGAPGFDWNIVLRG